MNDNFLYLYINFGTILFPLLFSFERRVAFFKQWRFLLPALLITATGFLLWDHIFTASGVWGFNARYTSGLQIGDLPIEEVLFFITIPYASIFIYAFLNYLYPETAFFDRNTLKINIALMLICGILLFAFYDRAYTAVNCSVALLLLAIQTFLIRGAYMGRFYRFYLWHLVPFFLVNGLLTGTGIAEPVVWYNNAETIGFRLFTIPVEDTLYSFSLMLMNIMIMESLSTYFVKRPKIPVGSRMSIH